MKHLFLSSFAALSSLCGASMVSNIVHAELGMKEVTSVSFGMDEGLNQEKTSAETEVERDKGKEQKSEISEVQRLTSIVHAELGTKEVTSVSFGITEGLNQEKTSAETEVERDEVTIGENSGRGKEQKGEISEEQRLTSDKLDMAKEIDSISTVEKSEAVDAHQAEKVSKAMSSNDIIVDMDGLNSENKLYALKGLNLPEAYVILKNNIIENIRTCGNISNVELQNDDSRRYLGDQGDKMIELLVKLFPSSAGSLNTESEVSSENFWSRYGGVPSELMAKFCSLLVDYRNELVKMPEDNTNIALDPDGKVNPTFKENVKWLQKNGFCEERLKNSAVIKALCDCCEAIDQIDIIQEKAEELKKQDPDIESKKSCDELSARLSGLQKRADEFDKKIRDIQACNEWTVEKLQGLIKELNKKAQEKFRIIDVSRKDEIIETVTKYLNAEKAKLKKQIVRFQSQRPADSELSERKKWLELKSNIERNRNVIESNYEPVLFLLSFVDTLKQCVDLEMQAKRNLGEMKDIEEKLTAVKSDESEDEKAQIESLKKRKDLLLKGMPIYPEYLTERILMTYVIKTLDSIEDTKYFYNELVRQLSKNKTNGLKEISREEEIQKALSKIKSVKDLLSKVNFQNLSPYKDKTCENGKVLRISTPNAENQVNFSVDTFADCVDVTMRHVLNLLIYSNDKSWGSFLDERNIDVINGQLQEVVKAIKTNGQVPFYDLKTRMQMFLLYQRNSRKGVDDQDNVVRTLWEYVICNMTEDTGDMYKIVYCKDGCEISSGYINMLKLMYNIAKVFNSGDKADEERKRKLGEAKENIDRLILLKSYDEKVFNAAIVSVFSLFHPKANLKFEYKDCKYIDIKKDISGEVCVCCDNGDDHLKFTIVFNDSLAHAKVIHIPSDLQDITRDYICDLDREVMTGFYTVFSNNDLFFNHPFAGNLLYKKFKTLKALMLLRENPNDFARIYDIFEGANLITVGSERELLFYHLYFKYLFRCEGDMTYGYNIRKEYKLYNEFIFNSPRYCLNIYDESQNEIQDFLCLKVGKDEVKLLITEKGAQKENLTIPSQVYDAKGNKLNVIRVGNVLDLKVQSIIFDGDFDQLALDCCAFEKNQSLKEVVFKGRAKNLSIGYSTFFESSLVDFRIESDDLTSLDIHVNAFSDSNLQNFVIPEGNKLMSLTFENYSFSRCKELKKFIIPENGCFTTLDISNFVFMECSKLEEFIFPQSATNIVVGVYAFAGTCIKNFDMPCKVNRASIRYGAFEDTKLTSLVIPCCDYNLDVEGSAGLKQCMLFVPINLKSNLAMIKKFEDAENTVWYYENEEDLRRKCAKK